MAWAVANDGGAEAATLDYATRGQPETFAISPSGTVVGVGDRAGHGQDPRHRWPRTGAERHEPAP